MKKKVKYIIGAAVVLVLMAGSFLGGFFSRNLTDPDLVTLRFVLDYYKKYYYEQTDDYIEIMANSILDKYSQYYTPEQYEILKKTSYGSRSGIGITFSNGPSGCAIAVIKGNSPAEKAGVKEGGTVKGVSKEVGGTFYDVSVYSDIASILNSVGDGVPFCMKVAYGTDEVVYELKKEEYRETFVYYSDDSGSYRFSDGTESDGQKSGQISFVRYSDAPVAAFDEKTAYIKYTSFSGLGSGFAGSIGEIEKVLSLFNENGKTKLIFDLRNNGGGYIDIMSEIASHFIDAEKDKNHLVAKAIYKDGSSSDFICRTSHYDKYGFEKIIFLANENTASASEALIGAVVDYDKKGIVDVVLERSVLGGEYVYKTYGKGIMQTTYPNIVGKDAIRLTTAKIFWPLSGTCIHDVGITKSGFPDLVYEPDFESGKDYVFDFALGLCEAA